MTFPDFITQDPNGFVHLTGHRIGLQDIVYCYGEGYSPEMLLAEFPTLNLSLIHKVLGFYLESQGEIDAYVARCDAEVDQQWAMTIAGPSHAELRRRLQSMTAPSSR